ncbi:type 1 glutamine amidotransferase, partial [Gemmatimonadota bacterium]
PGQNRAVIFTRLVGGFDVMSDARLLVIDNALDHDLYRPVDHWAAMVGYSPDSIHAPSGESLPNVDSYSHVILTGCEGSILDLPQWAKDESEWVGEAIECGAAVLGSCWGHQLIAVSQAGLGSVRRAANPEFGWIGIPIEDDGGLLPAASFQTFTAHFDEVVVDCHPEMRILATTAGCAVQAARWGTRPVWGIQAHPEVDPDNGTAFLKKAAESWPESVEVLRSALAGPVRDSGDGKRIARRFLATPAG